jgi:hypothetical protein
MTKQQYEKAVTALRENHRSMIFDEDYGEYVARVFYAARFWIEYDRGFDRSRMRNGMVRPTPNSWSFWRA